MRIALFLVDVGPLFRRLARPAAGNVVVLEILVTMRIPTKPASDSEQSPATRSNFIPAGIPI
jgi:hypothetical protein